MLEAWGSKLNVQLFTRKNFDENKHDFVRQEICFVFSGCSPADHHKTPQICFANPMWSSQCPDGNTQYDEIKCFYFWWHVLCLDVSLLSSKVNCHNGESLNVSVVIEKKQNINADSFCHFPLILVLVPPVSHTVSSLTCRFQFIQI